MIWNIPSNSSSALYHLGYMAVPDSKDRTGHLYVCRSSFLFAIARIPCPPRFFGALRGGFTFPEIPIHRSSRVPADVPGAAGSGIDRPGRADRFLLLFRKGYMHFQILPGDKAQALDRNISLLWKVGSLLRPRPQRSG